MLPYDIKGKKVIEYCTSKTTHKVVTDVQKKAIVKRNNKSTSARKEYLRARDIARTRRSLLDLNKDIKTAKDVAIKDSSKRSKKRIRGRRGSALDKNLVVTTKSTPNKSNKSVHNIVDKLGEEADNPTLKNDIRRFTRKIFSKIGEKYPIVADTLTSKSRYFTLAAFGVGAAIAGRHLLDVGSTLVDKPAIPKEYDRGYDYIKEQLTDFGSPVKLFKTAQKTITPYYSSVRRSVVTSTQTKIDSNLALSLHKNAINHTRY